MVPLSVLDLSPVAAGSSGAASLRNSLDLARLADRLGYTRYWVAEHHNLPSIASSAPDIMIGQIAAATERMRVGSGGVMLPNHAPLMVAERFKVLEALFPGRIDLGLGRAPGTDPVTSYALRRRQDTGGDDDFLERFQELILFESNGFPEGHPFRTHPRHAARRPAAADLAARIERLQRAARRHGRRRLSPSPTISPITIRSRPMLAYREQFKPSRRKRATQPPISPILGLLRRGLRRQRRRGGAARVHHRSQFRAPAARRISAARKPGGGRRLSLFAGRARH